jgi:hypothetical protein
MGRGSGGKGNNRGGHIFEADYSFDIFSLRADRQTPNSMISKAVVNMNLTLLFLMLQSMLRI